MMGRQGVIGSWLDDVFSTAFSFSWKGAALAEECRVAINGSLYSPELRTVDSKLEEAAATLGASPVRVFFTHYITSYDPGSLPAPCFHSQEVHEFGATISFCFKYSR